MCHAMHTLKNLPNEMEEVRFFEFSERFARRGIRYLPALTVRKRDCQNVTIPSSGHEYEQRKEDACNLPFPFVRQVDVFFFQRMEIGNWEKIHFRDSFSIRPCEISLIS